MSASSSSISPSPCHAESAHACAATAAAINAVNANDACATTARRLGPRRRAGFTLIELMVALTMGLIVGVAVVGLSHEVTTTFHEESRIVSAESGLRTAMDRLRNDIARASMMSSPNVTVEPSAKNQGTANVFVTNQAGLRIYAGGSMSATFMSQSPGSSAPGPLTTDDGLTPDAIDITGNLSPNGDYYSSQGLGSGGCGTRILLAPTDALYRLGSPTATTPAGLSNATTIDLALRRAFFPNAAASGAAPTTISNARIIDRASKVVPNPIQYVQVCNAGYDGTNAYVDLESHSTIDAVGSNAFDHMMINPVLTVRWRIVPSSGPLNPTGDPLKFDLLRTFLDATGTEIGGADNAVGEIVAEYVVDMKFSETVDETPPSGSDAGAAVNPTKLVQVPFDNTLNWAGPLNGATPSTTTLVAPAPQRVRSVGIRLAARGAVADRTADLPSAVGAPYLYRYALDAGFARVRTLMSEVSLQNQMNATYP